MHVFEGGPALDEKAILFNQNYLRMNKSSAVAEMAAQCCTSQFRDKSGGGECASTVTHRLHLFVADTNGLALVSLT